MSDSPARDALACIDKVLAERPVKDGRALSEATRKLCVYREALIAGATADRGRRRDLDHLNAILSIVTGVHFPLGDVPWDELAKARGWLADLLAAAP
jgi:hypothetical protein